VYWHVREREGGSSGPTGRKLDPGPESFARMMKRVRTVFGGPPKEGKVLKRLKVAEDTATKVGENSWGGIPEKSPL